MQFDEATARPSRRTRFDHPVYEVLRYLGVFEPLLRTYRRFSDFRRRYRALAGNGLVPEARLKDSHRDSIQRLQSLSGGRPLGDYLEFGVCYGSSLACMHDVLVEVGERNVRLFGFDSFEGMPEAAAMEDNGNWTPGQLRSSLPFARSLLTRRGVDWNRTFLLKGWFEATLTPETIAAHRIERASIMMFDCVIYSSTCTALRFCEPLIKDHAVLIFDDWHAFDLADQNMGERRAFEEFLARNPDLTTTPLPTYDRLAAVFLVTRTASLTESWD